ncbi:hypothetical protein ACOMHN_008177 [Nucella lapillus]
MADGARLAGPRGNGVQETTSRRKRKRSRVRRYSSSTYELDLPASPDRPSNTTPDTHTATTVATEHSIITEKPLKTSNKSKRNTARTENNTGALFKAVPCLCAVSLTFSGPPT